MVYIKWTDMTELSELSLLDKLERDIERILAINRTLRTENSNLKSENSKLKEITDQQIGTITQLQTDMDRILIQKSITETSEDVKSAKLRINRLIKEVDSCIALMNR